MTTGPFRNALDEAMHRIQSMFTSDAEPNRKDKDKAEALKIIAHMDDLRRECESMMDENIDGRTIRQHWEAAPGIFHGNQWRENQPNQSALPDVRGGRIPRFQSVGTDGLRQLTLNATAASVVSGWAIETERPDRPRFTAVESSDPSMWFIDPDLGEHIAQMIRTISETLPPGSPAPVQGLTIRQIKGIDPLDDRQKLVVEGSGIEATWPMPKNEWFTPVNDAIVAKVVQTTVDAKWDESEDAMVLFESKLWRRIYGHQPIVFEWIAERKNSKLTAWPVGNFWCEAKPLVKDMEWVMFDQVMSLQMAKERWPEYAADLDKAKQQGKIGDDSDKSGLLSTVNRNANYGRDMVRIRTLLERGHRYGMTVPEAIRSGKILRIKKQMLDEFGLPIPDPEEPAGTATLMRDVLVLADEETGLPAMTVSLDEVTGEEIQTEIEVSSDLDEKGQPIDPNWPTIVGIRHVSAIVAVDVIVEDHRCPFFDLPVAILKNVPVVQRPWGLGDPARLWSLQDAINRTCTYLINVLRYHAFPPELWPSSIFEAMKAAGYTGGTTPGQRIGIPDQKWKEFFMQGSGPRFQTNIPGDVGTYIQLLQVFLSWHDRLSGHVEVMQGRNPSGVTAGVAISQLQAAARGPAGTSARYTDSAVYRLARLKLQAMIDFMSPRDWAKYNGEFAKPVKMSDGTTVYPVLDEIMRRLEVQEFNITVEGSFGRLDKNARAEVATAARKMGDLSRENFLEAIEVIPNPKGETEKIIEEQRQMAQAMQPQQPMTPQPVQPQSPEVPI